MAPTIRKLTFAPVPTSDENEEVATIAKELLGVNSDAVKAIHCAAEKCVDTSISLERFSNQFKSAFNDSSSDRHYKHVTEGIVERDDTNCAILANERIRKWEARHYYPNSPSTARYDINRTLALVKFVREEHERSEIELSTQKRRTINVWSNAVRAWLSTERVTALRAIKNFTKTALCRTLRLFGDMRSREQGEEFLIALFRHKACDKHCTVESPQPYASDTSGRKADPFVNWCNFLAYTIPTRMVDGGELMERFIRFFNRGWRNNNLHFATEWQGKMFQGNRLETAYINHTDWYPPGEALRSAHRREAYIIETAIQLGNVSVLDALATSPQVNKLTFLDVLRMRLAVNITNRTANALTGHVFNDVLPLGNLGYDMLKYLFSAHRGKPALRPPSMLLDPPEVNTALGLQPQALIDFPISEAQRNCWIETAKRERRIWLEVHAHGWQIVRNAHKLNHIANWWKETALRYRYHAMEDEDGRPLMVGAAARQDQAAWATGGGVEALDAVTSNHAGRLVVDVKEALREAAMERDLIVAQEESRAAAAAAAAAAATTAAAKAALRRMAKKRNIAGVGN